MITTHVLDLARGRPAGRVPVLLEAFQQRRWRRIAKGRTDANGRLRFDVAVSRGRYRLTFRTRSALFPEIAIAFQARRPGGHYHIPLLLSPFGYSTYRGS